MIFFDTETKLIAPGLPFPPMVCLTWCEDQRQPRIIHAMDAKPLVESWLDSGQEICGHNVAFDLGVCIAQWPDLLDKVFQAYDQHRVVDTMVNQQLLDIADGCFRGRMVWDSELECEDGSVGGMKFIAHNYHLADLVRRHIRVNLRKDTWRMLYSHFIDLPLEAWPKKGEEMIAAGVQTDPLDPKSPPLPADSGDPRTYPLDDAWTTRDVWFAQGRELPNLRPMVVADFWLKLMSGWGLKTNPVGVAELERETKAEIVELQARLVELGLIRPNGSRDTKAAKAYMAKVCAENNVQPFRSDGGAISLSNDACSHSLDPVMQDYAKLAALKTTLDKDIPLLAGGMYKPISSHFNLAASLRTTSSNPNVQNFKRH